MAPRGRPAHPLFAIGEDRLSWYQRLPGAGCDGWAGILRGELPAAIGVAEARRLADRAAAELPRFAGRPHRDPRAPQSLAPVAGLEGACATAWATAASRCAPRGGPRPPPPSTPAPRGRRRPARAGGGVSAADQAPRPDRPRPPGRLSQTFSVGLADGQSLEVDDLVAVTTEDPAAT